MTVEIAKALQNIKEQMNEMGRRLDNLYSQLHKENKNKIEDIEDALCELSKEEVE